MIYPWGHARRFNDFGTYIRGQFGKRVQKISINAGFTCPNRDGTKGFGGCTFCNNESFKPSYCQPLLTVAEQIERGISFFKARREIDNFLAYFQAYTNTYGNAGQIIDLYNQALSQPNVVGLIVGTRPDCLPAELLEYFVAKREKFYIAVELGVESTNDATLELINRGHDFNTSREAILHLHELGIPVGVHLILGLPGEVRADYLNHASIISNLPVSYLKIHQMQFIGNSTLGNAFINNPGDFNFFNLEEYIDLVVDFVEILNPAIVIERFASQAPSELLLAPRWGLKNFELTRLVEVRLAERDSWQGKRF